MKKILFVTVFFLMLVSSTYSQTTTKILNFECGGYVTSIIPSGTPTALSNQILYARTDIGGVYRSTNNGENWTWISTYIRPEGFVNRSEYSIQGLVIKDNGNNNPNDDIIIVCWGDTPSEDYNQRPNIWRSINGGQTWDNSNINIPDNIRFRGNNTINGTDFGAFGVKIGGECIIYDPRSSHPNVVYMGGFSTSGAHKIYKSTDNGLNWSEVSGLTLAANEGVICIKMNPDANEMFVGTTHNLYRTKNIGASPVVWETQYLDGLTSQPFTYARRVIFEGSGDAIKIFVAYDNNPTTSGAGLARKINLYNWETLVRAPSVNNLNFEIEFYYNNNGSVINKTQFSTLTFGKLQTGQNQFIDVLVAGRYGRPLRYSSNFGYNWHGNAWIDNHGWSILFSYGSGNIYPQHQFTEEGYVHTGINNAVQNPNYTNTWYSTGGAGAFKSTANFPGINPFAAWKYMTNGMSMPVIYNVSFRPGTFNQVLYPMSDWTMGYSSVTEAYNNHPIKSDRRLTRRYGNSGETYIPNVTRALSRPYYNTHVSYGIGGSVYEADNLIAAMYRRESNSSSVVLTGKYNVGSFNSNFSKHDRCFTDGLTWHNSQNSDRMVVIFGRSKQKQQPTGSFSDLGLYYSTNFNPGWNGGGTFQKSQFTGHYGEQDLNTLDKYESSIIPGGSYVGDLFSSQFNLAKGPDNIVYCYLEGENSGGGFFRSTNGGANFKFETNIVGYPLYIDEGCLKYTQYGDIFIAIKGHGLYRNINPEGTTDFENFVNIGDFISARQVDAKITGGGNKTVYVYGKKAGDVGYKLYKSENNGNTFSLIRNDITGVRSLTINPNPSKDNELWIGTAGRGVIIHTEPPYQIVHDGLIVEDSLFISQEVIFDSDVIVKAGANMYINEGATLMFENDKKIIVESGGAVYTLGGQSVFKKTSNASSWGGIEVQGNGNLQLTNCTFENSSRLIHISNINDENITETIQITGCTFNNGFIEVDGRSDVKIVNNTWNYTSSSTPDVCGVMSTGTSNLLIKDNEINYSMYSSNTTGISIIYGENVSVVGNDIQNTSTGISISNSSPFVAWNIISTGDPSSTSSGIFVDNSYAAIINKNYITDYFEGISLYYSSPTMYGNVVLNESGDYDNNAIAAIYGSYARLSPLQDGSKTIWDAGNNEFIVTSSGNSMYVRESMPLLECGYNKISASLYNIYGNTEEQDDWDANNNNWLDNPPDPGKFSLDNGILLDMFVTLDPTFDDNGLIPYFGVDDTVMISNSSSCDEGDNASMYKMALVLESEGEYASAINLYKQFIAGNVGNVYSIMAMKRIMYCALRLDYTTSNYGDLRSYFDNLKSSHAADTSLVKVAKELASKCLVRQDDFSSAILEYEQVVTSSSDPGEILIAQLNILETYLIIAQGQGDNMNSGFTGQLATLKPADTKDAIKKINALLGRNNKTPVNPMNIIPEEFELSQNFPNPFNPITNIRFSLPTDAVVSIKVYDMTGREIANLLNSENLRQGIHTVSFNGSYFSSGVYFYRMFAKNQNGSGKDFIQAKKMVLIK